MALDHLVASLFLLPAASLALQAGDVVWTNASSGSWSTAANWEPNRVPGADDAVFITRPGTYTVKLTDDTEVRDLTLGGVAGVQTLSTSGRVLALGGAGRVGPTGQFLLAGGALSGTGQLEIEGGMTWQYGSVDTNATVVVRESGTLTMESAGNHAKLLYGSLTNAGIVTWKPYGGFRVDGTFHNLAAGVFDIQEDNISITRATDSGTIINEGRIRKTTAGVIGCSVPLIHQGTVETAVGTLNLHSGGILRSGCVFAGAGVTRLNSDTHTIEGDLYSTNLVLAGASLGGDSRLHGTLVWESGTLLAGASMTTLPESQLLLSSGGNNTKFILGNLTNAGTITWKMYGNAQLGGTLHNLPGAMFDLQLDSRVMNAASDEALFLNEGLLRKTTGTYAVGCNVPTINRGSIELTSGTLSFDRGCTNEAGTILLAGATLDAPVGLELAGGRLSGWGTVSGNVMNRAATVSPDAANGGLKIKGQYTQQLLATLELTLAGNSPGIDQSRLDITREARLVGTLGVVLGPDYLPAAGTVFEVLTALSRTGDFDAANGRYLLGKGLRLDPVYGGDRVTLVAVAAPDPDVVPLVVAAGGDAVLVSWPTEFTGGTLLRKDAVGQGDWTPLPDAPHRHVESPPAPERYFRLGSP